MRKKNPIEDKMGKSNNSEFTVKATFSDSSKLDGKVGYDLIGFRNICVWEKEFPTTAASLKQN